jgi:hypothetical protein
MESCGIENDPSEVRVSNPRPKRLSKHSRKLRALSLNKSQGKALASGTKQRQFGIYEFQIDDVTKGRSDKFKEKGSKYRQPASSNEVGYFEDLKDQAAGYMYLLKFGWRTVQYYRENCAN